jgi:pyruvate formate lyase activating enzyme
MKIGGLQKVSLIDYPGKICAIIFSQGCNFRCPYCHNPELVDPDIYGECLSEEGVFSFLKKRRGKLDAVSITGGEPTIQHDLAAFVKNIRTLGYLVKIDTNGSNPEVINNLIKKKLVDYIAMDVKGPMQKYRTLTRSQVVEKKIQQSITTIMTSGIPYEFRTTIVKSQLNLDDLLAIGKLIKNARLYVLQQFVASKTLDQSYIHEVTYTQLELEAMKQKLMKDIPDVMVR